MNLLRAGRSVAKAFCIAEAGTVSIEFAFCLPIMVTLWLGGTELQHMLQANRRVNLATTTVGDTVGRFPDLTRETVDDILALAPGLMLPFASDGARLQVRVSAVDIQSDGKAVVAWSRGRSMKERTSGADITSELPASVRVHGTQVIFSELAYQYEPLFGDSFLSAVNFTEQLYFSPRRTERVKLCYAGRKNCI